jgi:flagellar basal-body rod modification protein FlgD
MNIDEANAAYYQADSKAAKSAVSLADNFDDFLTMLTTQLQNQDPLNPTDSNEFTNQLVSFTGVEQSIATNQNLEALIQLQSISQQNNEATVLIGYLGKTVGTDLNITKLSDQGASWNLDFGSNADEVTYDIYDSNGNKVKSETVSTITSEGEHVYNWDGSIANGGQAPEGNYYLVANATTDGGSQVNVGYHFEGYASKVETVNGQPVLMVDGIPLGLSNITSVQVAETETEGV